jgi:hypothetical protein
VDREMQLTAAIRDLNVVKNNLIVQYGKTTSHHELEVIPKDILKVHNVSKLLREMRAESMWQF